MRNLFSKLLVLVLVFIVLLNLIVMKDEVYSATKGYLAEEVSTALNGHVISRERPEINSKLEEIKIDLQKYKVATMNGSDNIDEAMKSISYAVELFENFNYNNNFKIISSLSEAIIYLTGPQTIFSKDAGLVDAVNRIYYERFGYKYFDNWKMVPDLAFGGTAGEKDNLEEDSSVELKLYGIKREYDFDWNEYELTAKNSDENLNHYRHIGNVAIGSKGWYEVILNSEYIQSELNDDGITTFLLRDIERERVAKIISNSGKEDQQPYLEVHLGQVRQCL